MKIGERLRDIRILVTTQRVGAEDGRKVGAEGIDMDPIRPTHSIG